MNVDLEKLNTAVELLERQKAFLKTIERLSTEIDHSREPFVWSVVDLASIDAELPEAIRSAWIFVLKKDVWSGCHYHPNSIQHMVVINGEGTAKVAGKSSSMVQFGSPDSSLADKWFVIDKGIPHEFLPENENMVVVSFHTCGATELEEVDCETGAKRVYEKEI